jgi:hypothetical protein
MTDEQRSKIHAALEVSSGNHQRAAVALEMTTNQLAQLISGDPTLMDRWGKEKRKKFPDQAVTLNRIAVTQDLTDMAMADSLAREDAKLTECLEKIGFTQDQAGVAMTLQGIARSHFRSTFEFLHGGLVISALSVFNERQRSEKIISDLQHELQDTSKYAYGSELRSKMVGELLDISNHLRACDKMLTTSQDVALRGALAAVRLKQPAKDKKEKLTFKESHDGKNPNA